jgi:hypothetical protein
MPKFPTIIKEITYRVRADETPIIIWAKVGSAQRGVPVAILDENTILPKKINKDGSREFKAGTGSDLIGHVVRVQTFVSDVNPHTNLTIVNYEIKGGLQTVFDNTQKDVEEEGGRIIHFLFITFEA